jgi:cell division protein FtsI/penicillin-binding protein 2
MEAVCSKGGTAFTFFDFSQKHNGTNVVCKTGTAEVGTDGTPHAWFTFFAPAESPQIVTTVLIEKGGEGSSIAGPIARKIADYYFAPQSN